MPLQIPLLSTPVVDVGVSAGRNLYYSFKDSLARRIDCHSSRQAMLLHVVSSAVCEVDLVFFSEVHHFSLFCFNIFFTGIFLRR